MANLFDTSPICSSYSPPPEHADDISLLLRQILFKSSSSSSSSALAPKQVQCEIQQQQPHQSSSVPAANIPAHLSSSSVGTVDYDADEYDCESEEGFENLMGEMVAKPNPPRNPSKRTRAAEVHNLSEKRRRSRINEKMKALQKLIPNSNKTDKASMLDEAIEYLKQLQLQVQMLTMRNGINLYSMCAPPPGHGVVQQNQNQNQMNGGLNQGGQPPNMTAILEPVVNNQPLLLDFSNHQPSHGRSS